MRDAGLPTETILSTPGCFTQIRMEPGPGGEITGATGCEHDPCHPDGTLRSCAEHSHCVAKEISYSCECDEGWIGNATNCDHPIGCDSHPCQHGGTCTATGADHQCQCPSGWEGETCANNCSEHGFALVDSKVATTAEGKAFIEDALPTGATCSPRTIMQHALWGYTYG